MKFWTGLLVLVLLASLPVGAKVITLTSFYEKIASMFSESCPHQSPSEGLDLFKNELQECYEGKAIPEPEELKLTGVPLGLDGDVPDEDLYASSYRDDYSYPGRGRLNAIKEGDFNGAWCSEVNNDLQFFQVDIGAVSIVTAILTQGDNDELNWVQSYTLEISMDGFHWGCVFGSDGRVKVFVANKDSDSVKINVMHPFIVTRYIRIIPKSWTGHICLRAEIYVKERKPREVDDTGPLTDVEAEVLEVHPKNAKSLIIKNDPSQVDTGVLPELYVDQHAAPYKSISFEHLKVMPDLYQVQPDVEAEVLEVHPKNAKSLIIKNDPSQVDTGVLPELYVDQHAAPYKSISFEHLKVMPDLYQVQPGGVGRKPLRPNIKLDPLYIAGGGAVVDRTIAPGPYGIPLEVSTDYGPSPFPIEFEWCPPDGRYEANMYVEVAFSYPVSIRKFSTRAHQHSLEWVSAYKVEFLHPKLQEWVSLQGKDRETIRIDGNSDSIGPRDHIYRPSIYTSRFRMYILDWNIKPCMTVQLYMNAEPREAPQIVTGPVYKDSFIWWAWEEQKPEKDYIQEAYFKDELILKAFEFETGSTIEGYKLQYLNYHGEWVDIFGDETTELSNGDVLDVDGIVARGLRIIVLSWSGERLYAEVKLEVQTETDNDIEILDILELSSHYLYYQWEDFNPVSWSAIIFSFKDITQVTRIETRGIHGAWVSSYHLECRTHFANSGLEVVLSGNTNDKDIVEHIFSEAMFCKYVLITPVVTDRIGMDIYIYTDRELEDASAEISVPGSNRGNTAGKWSPATFGDIPYIQFDSDHHITPTSITLKAAEGSSIESFHIQKSSDGNTFEPLLDGNGDNEVFWLGRTNFERRFDALGLRLFPRLKNQNGNIGFEWDISFLSEKSVNIVPQLYPGEDSSGPESGPIDRSIKGPRGFLQGEYISGGREAGNHITQVSFVEKPEIVSRIQLKQVGSTSGTFNLMYITDTSEDFIPYITEEGQDISADDAGTWINLEDRLIRELKIILYKDAGQDVRYEYKIELLGDIGEFSTSLAFDSEAAETSEEQ
ncbi:putative carboxypeptidase X1 [Holothuria leucospilota]|uniref:Carboxypeptidase X1 n=1 Tax=Holothuria leucospilota TaxID=206669 RepID=A0A9Q1BGF4_HOLLE|nr:putative carboxypeptidase X1 [Holothuria leucospilota]